MKFQTMHSLPATILFLAATVFSSAVMAALPKTVVDKIHQTTFEVVVTKPVKDSLKYERKLPLELLPYQVRNDKYVSVGTAFAIGKNRYASAAHVFALELDSFYNDFYLRDKSGKVYPVQDVYKYSNRHDFIVFSVKGDLAKSALEFNTKLGLNEPVYAVGNAYGEGIVIREGSYTSNTKEERDGLWDWMRFSAAASPGNSGGPLMDKDGNVVGIVLRKSENENLNYALPIKEMVKAKDNVATLDSMLIYRIDNMPFTSRDTLTENTKLPMDYKKLGDVLMAQMKKFSTSLLDKLVRENKKEIFPSGKGSDVLLSRSYSSIFPSIIARSDDGFWDTYEPKNIENSDLGNNGYMAYGSLGDSLFVRVHKPDDVSLKQFYKNSQLFMDLFLKGITVSRKIGAEEIKIVSMGKPSEEYIHTDSYQRKWQVKIWDSEYSDRKYIAFCLPVPDGYIAMMRSPRSGRISSHIDDLVTLTDFIYVSYYGTLEEWKQFIALKDMIPPVFSSFKLDYQYSDYFKYASQRLAISYSAKDIEITKDSDLELVFSYFKDNNKVIWDVSRIILGANKDQGTFVQVERNVRPPDHINQKYRQKWGDIVEQRTPYDKKIFFEDQRSFIGAAYTNNGKNISNSDLIYTVVYGEDGTSEKDTMKGTLEKFIQNLEVYEISDSKQPASRKKGI